MGTSIGSALVTNGIRVHWLDTGRSAATAARAADNGFVRQDSLSAVLDSVDAVFSICPPEFAVELGREVLEAGFAGTFVDGNAISPETSATISDLFGARHVDGGIVGPPAWTPGTTRFFLAGERADEVASLFDGSPVEARVISDAPGAASALKMAYAAWTKGGGALLLAVVALAERHGVAGPLFEEWDRSQPGLSARASGTAQSMSGKAWRFVGEMDEIEKTLTGADLPAGFFAAAADLYGRLAAFRDSPQELRAVTERLLDDE
jgi:3-hydroxyisobutyrate dehydrogenase-like beta-hydroxyacid dehydrogenase